MLEFLGARHLTAGQLVEVSGLGKFLTCQAISELAEMGAISIVQSGAGLPGAAAPGFNVTAQASVITLMLKNLGWLIRRLSIYPFNSPKVLSALEEFFYLFNGLGLEGQGLEFIPRLEGTLVNGQALEPKYQLVIQFGLYLNQRQVQKLELLPQLKNDELKSFAYLLSLPSDLVQMLNGLESLVRGHQFPHIRLEHRRESLEPLTSSEKVFVIPSRFLEALEDQDNEAARRQESRRLFDSLRQAIALPLPALKPEHILMLEEAENAAEKAFGVFGRGGREKYIEKTVQVLMRLPPAPRLAFIKGKVNDVRWLFQIDNIMALSQEQFSRLNLRPGG